MVVEDSVPHSPVIRKRPRGSLGPGARERAVPPLININKDTTFLVSDELGNVPQGAEYGLYHDDTRHLCRYELTLAGQLPLCLSARATDHSTALHFLTNPSLPEVPRGLL